jgi:type II restriction/modification system DNA methylase subunit YeeA
VLKKFAQAARRQLMEQVEARLDQVLSADTVETREKAEAIKQLETEISQASRDAVIERVAYTWFNRFCALRYMDVNRYTSIGVITPVEGYTLPEILQEAKQGHIDKRLSRFVDFQKVFDLLGGQTPSSDPQQEAYRLLLVAECNYWNLAMPFLFEKIADYTELLMPADLLSESSFLTAVQETLTSDACSDIEVIGWLYQFYISEKKDEVFEGLKKNKKITPENIPAATQLFTPHWIVRYLVENSLGRLWMLNRPESKLVDKMDCYIKPEEPETDFLKVNSAEEIKVCDPACGSGHMLVYAFEVLHEIYEEEGYEPKEIPSKILTKNLYGIEIDRRAGELAAFALTMKAREKQRRFFNNPVQPNICVLENIHFDEAELNEYMNFVGLDLFTAPLKETLRQFREAKNFGSLIRPILRDLRNVKKTLAEKNVSDQLFLNHTNQKVQVILNQADYLCPKYHVVLTNPPYMGVKNMSNRLAQWIKMNYKDSRPDLFSAFMERGLELALNGGLLSMITMQNWMFLSSFEAFRSTVLCENTIVSMAHLGARAFDSIGGEVVSTTAFVINNVVNTNYFGDYIRATEGNSELSKQKIIRESIKRPNSSHNFKCTARDFEKIPGKPIAYWVSDSIRDVFLKSKNLDSVSDIKQGLATCNNALFTRYWFEVSQNKIGYEISSQKEAFLSNKKWFPYNKGGGFRKWYGNTEYVVNWEKNGIEIHKYSNLPIDYSAAPVRAKQYYFREGITYNLISTSGFSARRVFTGFIFDVGGSMIFPDTNIEELLGFLCSKLATTFISILNPTMNYQVGDVQRLPILDRALVNVSNDWSKIIDLSKEDWDSYEFSWDYERPPILNFDCKKHTLFRVYNLLRKLWWDNTIKMKDLEEENNKAFIEHYELQGEISPELSLSDITLSTNPHYRYGGERSTEDYESFLIADTMKELISYAVGCMFGRYSIDKPGLILANQGETIQDYLKQIPEPNFPADDDNVIPLLDGDWFIDDITERFRKFLRVTFGEEHYDENLAFIEDAIGKDIRKFFLKDFYTDHVKRYKKRPIYWMFSSPKGSFNALIYMHRYRPDTVSIILNDYLRDFVAKLESRKEHLEKISISATAKQAEKTKAVKEVEKIKKILTELEDWEREVLYPLAMKRIEIDLDDGVKVNYNKFGKALKKVPGLSA